MLKEIFKSTIILIKSRKPTPQGREYIENTLCRNLTDYTAVHMPEPFHNYINNSGAMLTRLKKNMCTESKASSRSVEGCKEKSSCNEIFPTQEIQHYSWKLSISKMPQPKLTLTSEGVWHRQDHEHAPATHPELTIVTHFRLWTWFRKTANLILGICKVLKMS